MKKFIHNLRVIKDFIRCIPTLALFKPPTNDSPESIGLLFQNTAAKYANKSAIIFEGRELNWQEFNQLANQFAHQLKKQGVQRGDTVSILMENRIEMLCGYIGILKLGAVAGLINTNLTGTPLVHCVSTIESNKCLVGEELWNNISAVKDQLDLADKDYLWVSDAAKGGSCPSDATDFTSQLDAMPVTNLAETSSLLAGEQACYIFTSGTTGLPKAAVLYHRKLLSAAVPYSKIGFQAKSSDRMYICLPLYHITGLGPGIGSCLFSGASIFLRRRFSATNFWSEVQQHQTTLFVYVGELCRYLSNQPECPEEIDNPIRCMLGNGLRPDIWDDFRQRFKIKRICEIYGASESNVSFLNLLNKDYTIGTSDADLMLVKYDIEADEIIRDADGNLIEVAEGDAGLMLAKVDKKYIYDGYKNKEVSESKLLRDVKEPGDSWFNSGDIIRKIDVGFAMGRPHFQFVDRVGDTFRWRAENVSTNEVGEILNHCQQVEISNVYGVEIPGAEGKAGMAAITLKKGCNFDTKAFAEYVDQQLSSYARPIFVRIEDEQEVTGTFKLFKGKLRKEAFHLDQTDNAIYVRKPKSASYELLDQAFYQQIMDGKSGY